MFSNFTDYLFWFSQPSSIVLSVEDKMFGYISLGLVVLAIIFRLLVKFSKDEVDRKLFGKIWVMAIVVGFLGLLWFGLRFESTPIFAKRFWAGINLAVAVVWLGFILLYFIFN